MINTLATDQKESALVGVTEIKTVLSDTEQNQLRQQGRGAPLLECRNQEIACAELQAALAFEKELSDSDHSGSTIADFNPVRYASLYPDVQMSGLSLLQHFYAMVAKWDTRPRGDNAYTMSRCRHSSCQIKHGQS